MRPIAEGPRRSGFSYRVALPLPRVRFRATLDWELNPKLSQAARETPQRSADPGRWPRDGDLETAGIASSSLAGSAGQVRGDGAIKPGAGGRPIG